MQVEVVLEYPRHVYRVPGDKGGSGFLPGLTYSELLVGSDEEVKVAMSEGFQLTPGDARDKPWNPEAPKAEKAEKVDKPSKAEK